MAAPNQHPESPVDRMAGDGTDLRAAQDRFVALWGRMGSTWGIPRTMAQVHAVLLVVGAPMNTDEIIERLGISRGNASMTLRRLADWGVISRVHRRGDRKEYYQAEQDVWKMFRTILEQRKKREVDPLLDELEACRRMTEPAAARRVDSSAAALRAHNDRLDDLIAFMRLVDTISETFISPSGQGLERAAKLLERAS